MAGKIGSALPALAFASIDPVNDLLSIFDASATGSSPDDYQKKIAVIEFLKRMLGSSDLTWMSTIALSGVAPADDKFLLFDQSATAFKAMTASELLNGTLAGTSISGIGTLATLADVDSAADKFLVWDNDATAWKVLGTAEIVSRLISYPTLNITSSPRSVLTSETGRRFSNYGTTVDEVFNLPAGANGLRYAFLRQNTSYYMRLDPNGSETIFGGGAGKYLSISGRGQVDVEWVNGGWEVTGGSSIVDLEG